MLENQYEAEDSNSPRQMREGRRPPITRRTFVLRAAGLGIGATVLPGLLAACATTPSGQGTGAGTGGAAPTSPPAAGAQGAAASPAAKSAVQPTPTPVVEAKTSAAVASGQAVKITAWTIGPDAPSFYRRDNLVAAAETLNKALEQEGSSQRVQVEATFESGGQWSDYLQKFTLAAEAKQAPDIILGGHENFAPWLSAGYTVELDPLMQKDQAKLTQFADVIPTLWDAMKLKGKTFAIPQDTEARPMYYRKDLLAKLGWPKEQIDGLPEAVKKGEWSMQDLMATAKEAIDKQLVEPGRGWYNRPTRGNDHYMFYYQNGGQMQDKQSGKLVLVRDALEKFYQVPYDAVKTYKISSENLIGSEFRIWHETVTSGKVLFYNAGTWTWKEWQTTYKVPEQDLWNNVGFMLIPAAQRGGKPVTLSHPLAYGVTANSKNPELALRLLAHATTPELNSRHAVESAHLAILTTQEKDPTYQKDKFLLATGYMSNFTNFIPNHPKYGTYDEVLFRLLSAVASGQMQPKQAAEVGVEELRAQLKDELTVV